MTSPIPPEPEAANPRLSVSHPSLAGHAARGVGWLLLQTAGAKIVALGAQVALAWLLRREDFGLLSKTFTVAALPGLLYQVGLREVLLGRTTSARRIDRWVGPATWMAGGLGVLSALLMLLLAPVAAAFLYPVHVAGEAASADRRQLVLMVAVLAWAAPVLALGNVPVAQLQARLRFRAVAGVNFLQLATISVLSICFALAGFGAYSFVLPWPLAAMVRLVVLWVLAPPPLPLRPRLNRWRYLASDTGHVLAARALALVTELGDYVVLGRFHPDVIVGVYYFAFNLSLQTAMLLALNLDGVLMPVLSKLRDEPARQRDAFLSAARAIALVGIPICFLQAVVAGPVIRLVFDPKWYAAIPVLQVLSVGMAFRVLTHPAQSLMRAQGRFATLTRLNGIGAIAFVALTTGAAARAMEGAAAVWVAFAVAVFFAVEGPAYMYLSVRRAGARRRDVALVYALPTLLAATAGMLSISIARVLPTAPGRVGAAIEAAVLCGAFTIAYGAGVRLVLPATWSDLIGRFLPRRE